MLTKWMRKDRLLVVLTLMLVSIFALNVTAANTLDVLNGQITVTDSIGNGSASDGVVTISAKGGMFSKETNTVTITNNAGFKAQVSFSYTASTYNSFTIAEASASPSGNYSAVLDAGSTITITIQSNSGLSDLTATLKLSDFSLVAIQDSSNVTFNFDSTLGSVIVDGTAVKPGTVVNISSTTGAALVATAQSGSAFLGWVDANGKIISTAASYTLISAQNMTVKAVFAEDGGLPVFMLGVADTHEYESKLLIVTVTSFEYYTISEGYLFEGLSEAIAATSTLNLKNMVLMNNAVLPAGNYTIPADVSLLIPFDSANTMYKTGVVSTSNYTKPTAFRTLTMADGANLIINGSMSVSGQHVYTTASSSRGSSPSGKVGFVKMNEDSSITIEDGGALYVYGYITGSGSISANSGATVYELFQIADFRGGTQTTDDEMKTKRVFPLSQYYVQNIEVPLTLKAGASEFAYTTIYMSSTQFGTAVEFVGSSGMFRVNNGYAIKKYDGTKDRLVMEVSGTASIANISLTVGGTTINSADYVLPINNNISLTVKSGSNITVSQDLALLPGSEVVIENTATVTVNEGNMIIAYDAEQWGAFCGSANKTFMPLEHVPGRTYNRKDSDLVDASVCVNGTIIALKGSVYTTSGGANIYSTGSGQIQLGPIEDSYTYQLVQGTGYTEITITSPKLKNENGDFVDTSSASTATTYNHDHYTCTAHGDTAEDSTKAKCGVWFAGKHEDVIQAAVDATCTVDGKTEGKYCACGSHVEKTQEVISALGHTEVIDAAVAATCTTTGLTEGKHCSVCATVLTAQTVLDQRPHYWSAWEGNSTTFTTTCEHGCEDTVVLTLEYRLNDYIWLNAIVEGPEDVTLAESTYGYTFQAVNGTYYLVRKVHAKEIPTAFTVQFTALNADTPALDISFAAYKTILEAKDTTSDATKTLLTKMEAYGKAAEIYFDDTKKDAYNNDTTTTAPDLSMGDADVSMTRTESAASDIGATLKTNSAKVYFDEALRMSVFFTPTGFTESQIVKIGLLASAGTLDTTGVLTVSNHETMYVLYSATAPEISGGSGNYPADNPEFGDPTTDYAVLPATNDKGRWELCFDLTNEMYNQAYELRPFVIVEDESGTHYVYGDQVHYSLAAYISRTYTNADKAFKNLLVATWDYVVAADAAF